MLVLSDLSFGPQSGSTVSFKQQHGKIELIEPHFIPGNPATPRRVSIHQMEAGSKNPSRKKSSPACLSLHPDANFDSVIARL